MPLPYRICFIVAIALLASRCTSGSYYVEPANGAPADLFTSSEVFQQDAGPTNVVLRSERESEVFLNTYPVVDREFLRDRFHRVDYSRHMVVGVVLGSRWGGSVTVSVDLVREENQRLVIYSTEYHPSTQTGDWSNPAHFVVVPRTNLPVAFADVDVVVEEEGG